MGGPVVAIIPARYASTRFPGKPLADIAGVPMVVRVARRVREAASVEALYVATDDGRIAGAVRDAGFRAVMTPSSCASGTDRVATALESANMLDARLVVNVQGDEPLIDPKDIDTVVTATLASGLGMGTLARVIGAHDQARFHDPNLVKVAVAGDGRALYFSRSPIPHGAAARRLAHVGLYAYTPKVLLRMRSLPPSPLEQAERLEQLRALEDGIPIHVAISTSAAPTAAVDVPEDIARVLSLLEDPAS